MRTKAIPNFGCKSMLFVVKYTCQLQKSHNCHRIRKATKWHDNARKRIEVARQNKEAYRSGRNETDSKSVVLV